MGWSRSVSFVLLNETSNIIKIRHCFTTIKVLTVYIYLDLKISKIFDDALSRGFAMLFIFTSFDESFKKMEIFS